MTDKSTPKTNAERQAEYRKRKAGESLQEVRGIFATAEQADKIKAYAATLSKAKPA
jgi:hypothetical protein